MKKKQSELIKQSLICQKDIRERQRGREGERKRERKTQVQANDARGWMAAANFRGRAGELRLILIKDKHPRSTRRRDALSRPTSTYNRPERLVRVSFCPLSPPSLSLCLTIVAVSPCCSPLVFLFLSSSVRSVVADFPRHSPSALSRRLSNETSDKTSETTTQQRSERTSGRDGRWGKAFSRGGKIVVERV